MHYSSCRGRDWQAARVERQLTKDQSWLRCVKRRGGLKGGEADEDELTATLESELGSWRDGSWLEEDSGR